MAERPTLAVLGAGSWGTALAALTTRNGVPTRLWGRDAAALAAMAEAGQNRRYLPEIQLPSELRFESDLAAAVRGAGIVLIVVPSHAFAAMLDEVAPLLDPGAGVAWATKGFEPGTGRFLHELVDEKLPGRAAAVVTGPSFAKEVALGLRQVAGQHKQGLTDGLDDRLGIEPLLFDGICGLLARGDVSEGEDDAGDAVVLRPVGNEAPQEPVAIMTRYFRLDARELCQHFVNITRQVGVGEFRRKVRQRPANVRRLEVEQLADGRRKPGYALVGVKEQRRHPGSGQQVVLIAA